MVLSPIRMSRAWAWLVTRVVCATHDKSLCGTWLIGHEGYKRVICSTYDSSHVWHIWFVTGVMYNTYESSRTSWLVTRVMYDTYDTWYMTWVIHNSVRDMTQFVTWLRAWHDSFIVTWVIRDSSHVWLESYIVTWIVYDTYVVWHICVSMYDTCVCRVIHRDSSHMCHIYSSHTVLYDTYDSWLESCLTHTSRVVHRDSWLESCMTHSYTHYDSWCHTWLDSYVSYMTNTTRLICVIHDSSHLVCHLWHTL